MFIDCAIYQDGRRDEEEFALAHALKRCRSDGCFAWIGLREPAGDEFESVRREFELHELAVEDAIEAHQRPKIEVYGDSLFVVLKTVHYDDAAEALHIGEIQIFVAEDFLITVRHGEGSPLADARKRLENDADLLRLGPIAGLYAILDRVVDDYEPVAIGIDNDVQEVEAEVFSPDGSGSGERIYRLEREVLAFQRAVSPLIQPLDKLTRGQYPLADERLASYFRDVNDHLLRLSGQIDSYRALLASVLQANLSQVTLRQNEDMRRISAWAAILAIPTAVAGIYGMNFKHMPELDWTYGYPTVLIVVSVSCVLLHRRLKRAGWL